MTSQLYIRQQWYVLAWSHELANGPLARTVMEQPIVVFRTEGGSVAALEDRCCHRAMPLSMGAVVGEHIRCVYHGLEFDCQGRCARIPGQEAIPKGFAVRRYPVVERDRMVWIWMGNPEGAQLQSIPTYPFHDDLEKWHTAYDMVPFACNYELIHDNLLDLTHLAYVHPHTIGGNAGAHFGAEMTITEDAQGLHVRRWMPGSVPPPTYALSVPLADRVDRWQEVHFRPGLVLNYSGAVNAGEDPSADGGYRARNLNALTPETATTTHYFFSASHGHRLDDPDWTRQHFEQIKQTFMEDYTVLMRQQLSISCSPERELRVVLADRAAARSRQLVQAAILHEAG